MVKRFLIPVLGAVLLLSVPKVAFAAYKRAVKPFPGFALNDSADGHPGGFFLSPFGKSRLTELREEDGYMMYRSEPDPSQAQKLKEEEEKKQKKSWEMLRDIVIVPKPPRHPALSPSSVPPSR